MTINATHIRRQLVAHQKDYAHIRDTLPHAIAAIATHIANGVDRDRQTAEDAGIRGVGHISDPTAAQALSHSAAHDRHLGHIEDDLTALWLVLGRLVDACNRWVMTPQNAEAHPRCSGGGGIEEWCRPTCTEYVSYQVRADGSYSYRGDGLCDACRMRRHRWQRRNDEAAA